MGVEEVGDASLTSPPGSLFGADADVGRHLASVHWEATALGPPATWPQSLRTAVNILLSSRFPMWMAWGPELTFFCNAAYRRDTLGRKYPWALGRPASEVWAEIWPDIGPRIDSVMSTGRATWDSALPLFLERSGYSEETYHTFSYSPLRDDDGQVVGMLCVVSEDTERVIAERRMATLRDLGSDPSVVRTERQMLDFAVEQLGRNLQDLPFTLIYLFSDDGDAHLAATSGIASGHPAAPEVLSADGMSVWPVKLPANAETVLIDVDGQSLNLPRGVWPDPPAQALVVPLLQQGAEPVGLLVAALNCHRRLDGPYRGFVELVAGHIAAGIGSARSYRAQQRRAEELAELDLAKTTFFSNISHEFRTPLTLILGPLAELRRNAHLDAGTREELELVHRNGLRLAKLVNTLLDFSRIQAGRMKARFEPVDLATVTAELASVFRSAVERAGLEFAVDCPPLTEPVYVDRDMWEKVVLNLLSNALKFTLDGAVTVRVTHDDGGAVVTVADTGVGIAAEEMPRLFERFHRVESGYARSTEGSGIGLALVKELIGLHGGAISAESEEGRGTTFTIRIPFGAGHLSSEDIAPPGRSSGVSTTADPYLQEALRWVPASDTEPHGGQAVTATVPSAGGTAVPARILVADDNADMRSYLTGLLQGAGYQVTAVSDGSQALESIRANLPDLVVSDVMMPGLDGLELLAALRSESRTAALPVLLLSARAGQESSIEGLQAGADDYLVKPFVAADFMARVRANVALARLRSHHSRWRTALIDSLQEAFFVCDEHGAIVETNTAFTDILGYGPEGLPYEPVQPWWPDPETDPDGYRQASQVFGGVLGESCGDFTLPVVHRDGHRLWVSASINPARDPDTGAHVTVGTFRDVTAEHYRVQRETALAALNVQLAEADTLDGALRAAVGELHRLWQARRVLAVTFPGVERDTAPDVICAGEPVQWSDLAKRQRAAITALRSADVLTADTEEYGTAGITLQHPRGVLVLWIELLEQRPFTSEDHTLLTVLAGRLGQGLQRVHRLDQQRETALTLQHAILGPANLPGGFAVRYHPASRPLQVGGDWYDVVDLGGGCIGLVVGDCVGHDLEAATVMGQLRSACRALLLDQPSPGAALASLDRFAARLPGARFTTVWCAVLSPHTGELVYSSAGHPPPVLVGSDGGIRLLDDARGFALALRSHQDRPEARVTLSARTTLLLYTDGLVERRRASLETGIGRAAALVAEGRSDALDAVADQLMSRLAPDDGYQDDVALLLYRQPAPLDMVFPARNEYLASSRTALRSWLTQAGVGPDQVMNVLIAAGEAVANAIEHGHRDRPDGFVTLRATALVDRLQVSVLDTGSWKTPRTEVDSRRGRGVALMEGLMDDVSIDPGDDGTAVHLDARII
ncbi:histidine kinase [Mycolicibacterium doricum]|uniref:histidine kinase n=1 Tax=Mycolicibacterium doricum TaxID=126673 RepID=A0A1X1TED9_9MYCO|nr:SpoIIE family protein phosphatase [Mycolicibacterium doricum]MCV7267713.1 SpoIIE family protein phosphatase [Mycolicibacterium doricum]ORV42907.1 histidine kinase [Mycolicibacterium doricum]BBZ05951.1 histidine kinase [Mycolicibacterium doricum]